ncbi:MAG: hypothetical protein ACRDP7_11990, partial [Trebonia sp.]
MKILDVSQHETAGSVVLPVETRLERGLLAYVVDRPTLVFRNASQQDGATGRREPAVMASLPSGPGTVYVGMDTSM